MGVWEIPQWLRTPYRGTKLSFQYPHGGRKPYVTSNPGVLMPSSGLQEH